MTATPETRSLEPENLEEVVIRFAGDSGDGMQLTGDRFTDVSAVFGNDLATMPNYPAEIRAPAGTIAGVSSFQVHISDHDIVTPGDAPNVLVAMNPAALKANLAELPPGSTILVNSDAFDDRNLTKVGYEANPLDNGSLASYHVVQVPMTSLTLESCKELGVKPPRRRALEELLRARAHLVDVHACPSTRPSSGSTRSSRRARRCATPTSPRSRPGCTSARPPSCSSTTRSSRPSSSLVTTATSPATSRWRTGSSPPRSSASLPILYASYPITPASDILHELSKHKNFGIRTLQAEDEIAAAAVAVGAAFAGQLGITATSGPGLDLKSEALGLAISLELPLVVVDVQRGGPSTGLPTKTEQSDLLLAMYGRHGESPLPIVAAYSPSHCFDAAFEAVRIALKYRTPVILLTDGYVANGSEPWKLPDIDDLPDISVPFATEPNHDGEFWPYLRDPETLARPWAIPGTPGLMHRIGGHREAGRHRQRQLRPGQPRADDPHPGRQGGAASPNDIPPVEVEGDADAERPGARAGGAPGGRSARRCAACGRPAPRSPTPTSRTSTRSRPTSARCSPGTRSCWSRR